MSKPVFEHRHYKRLAAIIADMRYLPIGQDMQAKVAEAFADGLKGTNPNYSRERFIAAAMGQPSNGRDKVR
ncbi:MAG: hypothetical protein EPO41_04010 [Reyranella sp.]|uniref:hypothetical protein n=1 Tax=Reyranella sp. TaxID=1929291 RepID=UPI001213AB13|nr:hypothetical protein [Reyranella sp.]TAJ97166.1 MAG: hypothetical protein EPO41_04010 [Reyranella sp.]